MAKKKNKAARSNNPAVRKPVAEIKQPRTLFGMWVAAARTRTLALAVAPVVFATAAAAVAQSRNWLLAGLALVVALSLQISVNYSNDYSDGIRGTDDNRVGPFRLTVSGAVKPKTVRLVSHLFAGVAALAGLAAVWITQLWWLIPVGAVAILAAWFYTGGKRPYGYAGFGELIAGVFFGPVAVVGTLWLQYRDFASDGLVLTLAIVGSVAFASISAAVLLVNNLRDINTDAAVGKRTLSVKIGVLWTKILFAVLLLIALSAAPVLTMLFKWCIPTFISWMLLLPALLIVFVYRKPTELITALKLVSFSALVLALGSGFGLTLYVF